MGCCDSRETNEHNLLDSGYNVQTHPGTENGLQLLPARCMHWLSSSLRWFSLPKQPPKHIQVGFAFEVGAPLVLLELFHSGLCSTGFPPDKRFAQQERSILGSEVLKRLLNTPIA